MRNRNYEGSDRLLQNRRKAQNEAAALDRDTAPRPEPLETPRFRPPGAEPEALLLQIRVRDPGKSRRCETGTPRTAGRERPAAPFLRAPERIQDRSPSRAPLKASAEE